MKVRRPLSLIMIGVIGALLWSAYVGQRHLVGLASPLDRIEAVAVDFRVLLFGSRVAPDEIVILAIDDETVASAGGFPLSRDRLARLIGQIEASGARALGVDLLLVDPSEADQSLAEALTLLPTVIAGAGQFDQMLVHRSAIPRPDGFLLPQEIFAAEASVGLVNVSTDIGGTPRHVPMVFQTTQGLAPSFTLRAAGLFAGAPVAIGPDGARMPDRTQALDLDWYLALRFYGPRGTIETISAELLLSGSAPDSRLDGRFVLLGATATGIGDRFNSPFDRILPGVEVLATGIANLMDGTGLVRDGQVRRIDVIAAGLLAVFAIAALCLLPLAPGSIAFAIVLSGWLAVVTLAFGQGYWFSMSLPIATSLPIFACVLLAGLILDRRDARKLSVARAELGRFQSPALAERIARDPSFLAQPEEQTAAILFIDLSGFSGASERLGPSATRDLLKALHVTVSETIEQYGGLILDYMGDGAMIGFGIPDESDDTPQQALLAAHALIRRVRDWIAGSRWRGQHLDVRAGVHFGPIMLSRLGHDNHQQIAASGDCVNVASRLIDVAKSNKASIAASSCLVLLAGPEQVPGPAGKKRVAIRGREEALDVVFW